jgi:hypothetical protein
MNTTIDADCTLIMPGGAVKALGHGKVGGMLVRFGLVDPQGDVFGPETDYWMRDGSRVGVVYHHALGNAGKARTSKGTPITFGRRRIGEVALKFQADGIAAEGTIDLAVPGAADFYEDVKAGMVGWSSGSVDRLVERTERADGATLITQWPIIEASLTYTPVERRNRAVALKSLLGPDTEHDATEPAAGPSLVEDLSRLAADAGRLLELTTKAVDQRASEGRTLSPPKLDAIKSVAEAYADLYQRCLDAGRQAEADDIGLDELDFALLDAFEAAIKS